MNKTGIAITSLLGGMIVGAAIAMLVTPQSGPELRKKIKDLADDEIDKVRDKINDLREKVADVRERVEETRCHCNE